MFEKLKDIVEFFDENDPSMPGGKAIDDPSGDSYQGTSWDADFYNQIWGFFLATVIEGFGSMERASGKHDTAESSDVLNAIKEIMKRITDQEVTPAIILAKLKKVHGIGSGLDSDLFGGKPPSYYLNQGTNYFIKTICGVETIFSYADLDMEYDPQKKYAVFVSVLGDYPEFVSFNAKFSEKGLHIRPLRLINGELVEGTKTEPWGIKKWGEGTKTIEATTWGEKTWGESEWSEAKNEGGDTWGGFDSMEINIIVKEVEHDRFTKRA